MEQIQKKFQTQHFIDGKFVNSIEQKTFDVICPFDESVLTKVQQGGKKDIDAAISAARKAFNGPWRNMGPTERARCMFKLADLIEKNLEEISLIESVNNGKTVSVCQTIDVPFAAKTFRYYAGWPDKIRGSTIPMDGPFNAYTIKEPVGVVGQILPWNFPLALLSWKLGPALATGCTVVVKTAEQTPLSALRIAQLSLEAGFPPGVINIVNGFGDIGSHLAKHGGIDKVAFTGSTEVGYEIMKTSHVSNLKRITLELGGKSPLIVTEKTNIDNAVFWGSMGLFFNAGQCCIAATRTYVHSSVYDEYVQKAVASAQKIKLGSPLEKQTDQGPLVSKEQMDRVLGYIDSGVKEGAKLLCGGKRHGTKGFFVEPTVFADVKDNMKIAREEIFGPVKCILKYDDIEQVIERANDTTYGLGAGVMCNDIETADMMIKRLRAGTVYVNCYNVLTQMTPFGGFKDSGLGRQLGEEGLNAYLELKTVIVKR